MSNLTHHANSDVINYLQVLALPRGSQLPTLTCHIYYSFFFYQEKSVTSPMRGCSTQPGFNALHALLLSVIFDLLVFFTNTYCCLQIFPSSATNLIHDYLLACSLCLPETLCIFWITAFRLGIAVRASFTGYPALRNCLLYLSNAVFQVLSHINIYLSWMDSPTPNKYREINGQIFMSFWSKQQVFLISWCKGSPGL